MTTQEQRAEWSALEQAATPGEWFAERVPFKDTDAACIDNTERRIITLYPPLENRHADAAFIAAARTAVPQLLADVDALQAERDALAAELASYKRQAAYISSVIDSEGKYVP